MGNPPNADTIAAQMEKISYLYEISVHCNSYTKGSIGFTTIGKTLISLRLSWKKYRISIDFPCFVKISPMSYGQKATDSEQERKRWYHCGSVGKNIQSNVHNVNFLYLTLQIPSDNRTWGTSGERDTVSRETGGEQVGIRFSSDNRTWGTSGERDAVSRETCGDRWGTSGDPILEWQSNMGNKWGTRCCQ